MNMATVAIAIIVVIGVLLWPFFRYPRKDRDPRRYSGWHYTGGDVDGSYSSGDGDMDPSHSYGDVGSHDGWDSGGGDVGSHDGWDSGGDGDGGSGDGGGGDGGGGE